MLAILDLDSPNHDERPCPVDMLVLHYTGMQSAQDALDRLRDPVARVSSHYVVGEDGTVWRLVREERRAWHAGVSFWRGRRGLNDCSVGIEIVNPGHEWGYRPFPAEQMRSVIALCLEILGRHAIPAWHVVGHSDVAPTRKQDPGELFDWRGLATAGIGLWSDTDPDEPADAAVSFARIGYEFADKADITAFQRHFLPHSVSGQADGQTCAMAATIAALTPAA